MPAALLGVALVVAVLIAGVVLGGWLADRDPPRSDPRSSDGRPPEDRGPPPPLSGAGQRPVGPPTVQVNQPQGDGDTVFVVHGRGWSPGTRITVTLVGRPASPDHPVVDGAGTFNYAVNQRHEFYPGRLPVGGHTVMVSAPGGRAERVSFRVDR